MRKRHPEDRLKSAGTRTERGSGEKLRKADVALAVVLFAAALALRLPFRSQFAYIWDSAEFSLAIGQYNVALSQPHAPGYFLYVMLGRLVNFLVGNPHASLVWLSVVCGSGLVMLLYVLGVEMFGRREGLAAALFGMTSPPVWFDSCVALTYVVDAFLVCVMMVWCWRAMRRGGSWKDTIGIGVLLAIIGGVRQQTIWALVPLLVFVFWNFEARRFRKFLVALIVTAVLCAVWMHWMVLMSGGWQSYWSALHRIVGYQARKTVAHGGWNALVWNLFFVGVFCSSGLMLGVLLLAGALVYRARVGNTERKREWDRCHVTAVRLLWLWILPMMLLGTLVGYTETPGHVFTYLPGLLLVAAVIAARLQGRWIYIGTVTAVGVANVLTFTEGPRDWDRIFVLTGYTARQIREHDGELACMVRAIRAQLRPEDTLVCHAQEYLPLGLRHLQLHLPEYEQYQFAVDRAMLSPADRPMMRVFGGRLGFVRGPELAGKRVLALIVPPGTSLDNYTRYVDIRGAKLLPESEGTVYKVPVEAMR